MNTVTLDPHVVWDRCTTEKARLARIPALDLTCCRQLLKTPGLTPKVRAALKRQVVEQVAERLPDDPTDLYGRMMRGLPIECSFSSADGFSGRGARRKGAA